MNKLAPRGRRNLSLTGGIKDLPERSLSLIRRILKLPAQLRARERLKVLFDRYIHLLGRRVLEADEMASKFPEFCQPCDAAFDAQVPDPPALDGRPAPELQNGFRHYGATFVYRLPRDAFRRLEVLASGGLLMDRNIIPNTGLGNQRATVAASIQPTLRRSRRESCVVAPWPHYMLMTYGDFLLHVLPRICRIFNRLNAEEKSRAVIAYPLAKQEWERDYLGKLGIEPGRLVDTRSCKLELPPGSVVYAPSGDVPGWSGRSAHPGDYGDARQAFRKYLTTGRAPSRRLYLQRKGRRRILNEKELLRALKPYGFEPIDLSDHSIPDQMALMAEASVILGAHGANLINMLWSPPGTTVVELFGRGFRPSFLRQMAFNLSLDYSYLAEYPLETHDFGHLNWDIGADTDAVGKYLARMFP